MKTKNLLFAIISVLCFLSILSNAQAPDWTWAKSAGGAGYENGISIVVDASGNLYVAGDFRSPTITFGSTTLTNSGGDDMFLVKYDENGNVVWAKSAGGTGFDCPSYIAVDASGNIYVPGIFKSPTITFGSTTLTNSGGYDMFLVKYDANGTVLWAKSSGGTDDDFAQSVTVDASGNTYVTGCFKSPTLTFGSTTLTNSGNDNMFLVKYDVNGNVLWAKSAGGTDSNIAWSVSMDASGNPIAAGEFTGTITFGSTTLTDSGGGNMFLVKYDANGTVLWAKSAGGTDYCWAYYNVVDASGNTYVTGGFGGSVTIGTYTLISYGQIDIFLAKYDANGNVLWAKSAGGTSNDDAMFVTVDASGNPYVAGDFLSPTITFGSTTLTNAGESDIFLVKYDKNGNVIWAKSAGGISKELPFSVGVDAYGNTYITGYFESPTLTFGSTTLMNTGADNTSDMFIAKLGNSTGINDLLSKSNTLKIYPNPSSNFVTIETSAIPINSQLSIIDPNGQELLTRQISEPRFVIDISTLPSGVYFVRLTNDWTVEVAKIIICN